MIDADTIRQALACGQPGCACGNPRGHVHCPAHEDVTPSLSVSNGGEKILVKCFGGCSQKRVIDALKVRDLWPSPNGNGAMFQGLTLADLASAKRLPVESLKKWGVGMVDYKGRPAVHIPYRDLEGKVTSRYRLHLSQEPRLIWRKGSKTFLYGLWRLPEFQDGWLLLVEGESDCWTAWEYGIPALGLPGKDTFKKPWAAHLQGFKVYAWIEPDAPELPGKLALHIPGVLVIQAPPGVKDISEAHLQGQDVAVLISELKAQARPPEPDGETATATTTGGFSLSDLGNSRRLVAQHGQDLHYCHLSKKWWTWTGKLWTVDSSGEVRRRAKLAIATIYGEAGAADEDSRKKIAAHALRSEHDSRIKGMLSLAESEPGIPVTPGQMDANPWLLNCLNGTIDLRTGALRPHGRADLITRLAPVEFDPTAPCPLWEKFLDHIQKANHDVISIIQRILGYALTGDCREQCLFLLWGSGANGKSTLLGIISSILGNYAMQTPTETLLAKQRGEIPNDIARLNGPRFVTALEVSQGRRLAEPLVKQLTGQDTIAARFLFGEYFDFKPQFKLFLGTNHKPIIKDTSHAMWRRIRLIPFPVEIPDAAQDRNLSGKLQAEAAGILAWMARGCLSWRHGGLGVPGEVTVATGDYRQEMDVLGDFLSECCMVAPGASATAAELYKNYTSWAGENGEKKPFSQKIFGTTLAERGFERTRGTGGKTVWQGIGVKSEG
jgi:putative DNA primase/helicase